MSRLADRKERESKSVVMEERAKRARKEKRGEEYLSAYGIGRRSISEGDKRGRIK